MPSTLSDDLFLSLGKRDADVIQSKVSKYLENKLFLSNGKSRKDNEIDADLARGVNICSILVAHQLRLDDFDVRSITKDIIKECISQLKVQHYPEMIISERNNKKKLFGKMGRSSREGILMHVLNEDGKLAFANLCKKMLNEGLPNSRAFVLFKEEINNLIQKIKIPDRRSRRVNIKKFIAENQLFIDAMEEEIEKAFRGVSNLM